MLNFLCIGAQKAGTTWLYERLRENTQIAFPAGKEVHYWNALRDVHPLSWYFGLFSDSNKINGDITPAYSILDDEKVAEIYRATPLTKVIFIMRNPIERAWSAALMALGRSEMTIEDASDGWFKDHFTSKGSVLRGDYERTIRIWSKYFPCGTHFKYFFYDDLEKSPRRFLNEICEFIGVEGASSQHEDVLSERVFAGPGCKLSPALSAFLVELYRQKIESLGDYISRDLSEWYKKYR